MQMSLEVIFCVTGSVILILALGIPMFTLALGKRLEKGWLFIASACIGMVLMVASQLGWKTTGIVLVVLFFVIIVFLRNIEFSWRVENRVERKKG